MTKAEQITNSLLKKARKPLYSKDKVLLQIYNKRDKKLINEKKLIPNYTPFAEEKKYRSVSII